MLLDLIAPDCTTCAAEPFKEPFLDWENPVQWYGVPSGETLGDSLMVAVIVMSRHSPPELRVALRSHTTTIGTDYQTLRTFVNDFLTTVLEYTSAAVLSESSVTSANNDPVPMHVGGEQGTEERARAIEERKESPRLVPMFSNRVPRSLINVRNWATQACQLHAETRQCSQFSCDTIITASSIRYQQCCSIFCRCVDDLWIMTVLSSKWSAEYSELMLDKGSEEHVCSPAFLPRGRVLSQLLGVMRPISGNVINNFDTSTLDMKIGGPSSSAHCHVLLHAGTVVKCFISVGKMIDSGNYRSELLVAAIWSTKPPRAESD